MSSYYDYKLEELKSISKKLDKLIEIQERPYKEQEHIEQLKRNEAQEKYILDLIDPKHYPKVNCPNLEPESPDCTNTGSPLHE